MNNEFIVRLLDSRKTFKVYDHNEKLAIRRLTQTFKGYSCTDNLHSKEYWLDLVREIESGRYILSINYDFKGVVEVIN